MGEATRGSGDLEEDLNASPRPGCPSRSCVPPSGIRFVVLSPPPPPKKKMGGTPDPPPARGGGGHEGGGKKWFGRVTGGVVGGILCLRRGRFLVLGLVSF